MYEGAVQDLIDELGRLPGVGPKSAQRIAFHLLAADPTDVRRLVDAVETSLARGPAVVVDLGDVTSLAPDAVGALRALADGRGLGGRAGLCWCGAPPSVEPALMGFAGARLAPVVRAG